MKLVVITIIMCSSNNVVISLYYCDISIVSSSLYLYVDFDNDKNIQKFELLPVETVQSILDFITYFIRQGKTWEIIPSFVLVLILDEKLSEFRSK